ncbi:VWA domain-containing protein [Vibrio parahaemolyticus]|nr:VWA domain-containing protein [Vibrio parahaemolyticus]EIO4612859.1 VWA domain-containing protein [Vibrio parahaemolyticus]EKA6052959.1 VWA domain-containing protein [Vibrio parahaemolyticus]ELA7844916.1 VWA domain-containing protein [Vibrio parahaemolyticus]ELA9308873.1 VWA domain-containing protein [Vibrio parahaemolyticus]
MMSESYLVQSPLLNLDSQFTCLDKVPEKFLPAVITGTFGELAERCESLFDSRSELLLGESPKSLCPLAPQPLQIYICKVVEDTGLNRYCLENEEVTDALLSDILVAIDTLESQAEPLVAERIKQLENEALNQIKLALEKKKNKRKQAKPLSLTDAQRAKIAATASEETWQQLLSSEAVIGILPDVWQERLAIWSELEEVFTELGLITGLGFDLSKGVFQSHGWLDITRLNKLVQKLPKLQNLIRDLGRDDQAEGSVLEDIVIKMSVASRHEKYVTTPLVPMETKGITRSDSISRMLPQEASLLTNPVLKKLWHAKRAEHALLSYSVEGTEVLETEEIREQEYVSEKQGHRKNKNRGPMVICLDTSGSMQGLPENIAKATVLECMKVAHKEKRRCYVYLFGSKKEISELELTLDVSGFNELLNFLTMSFGGGTDAEEPLNKALEKCDSEEWYKADILLVSDGEFSTSSGLSRKIKNRKEKQGLQVHGIQIGNSHYTAMSKICDPIHYFSEWVDLKR